MTLKLCLLRQISSGSAQSVHTVTSLGSSQLSPPVSRRARRCRRHAGHRPSAWRCWRRRRLLFWRLCWMMASSSPIRGRRSLMATRRMQCRIASLGTLITVVAVLPLARGQCGPGTYFFFGGCNACNEGTAKNSLDYNGCSGCAPGTYATWGCGIGQDVRHCTGATVCTACPSGTFSAAASAICCPRGSYATGGFRSDGECCSGSGTARACVQCPPGLTTPPGNPILPGPSGCSGRSCGAGSGYSAGGCELCPLGAYAAADDPLFVGTPLASCYQCPAGTSSNVTGATECTPCPVGFYSYLGAPTCTACPKGYSTPTASGTSITSCSICAPGFAPSFAGGAVSVLTCTAICAAGYFAPQGAVQCLPCPPGTYSLAASASCTLCPAGVYGSSSGLDSPACTSPCTSTAACPPGTASAPPAVPAPQLCTAGSGRSVPAALGLQIWPAANPINMRGVDLLIAPLELCRLMTSSSACSAAVSLVGTDGVARYVVGTAADFNVEPAESLTCGAL